MMFACSTNNHFKSLKSHFHTGSYIHIANVQICNKDDIAKLNHAWRLPKAELQTRRPVVDAKLQLAEHREGL